MKINIKPRHYLVADVLAPNDEDTVLRASLDVTSQDVLLLRDLIQNDIRIMIPSNQTTVTTVLTTYLTSSVYSRGIQFQRQYTVR